MTVATWPEGLPELSTIEGFAGQGFGDGRVSFGGESGAPKLFRDRYRLTDKPLTVTMQFAQSQLDTLEAFWTANKVLPFWFPDQQRHGRPITDDTGEAVTDDTGAPIPIAAYYAVMFDGAPSQPAFTGFAKGEEYYRVTLSLIIKPWPV